MYFVPEMPLCFNDFINADIALLKLMQSLYTRIAVSLLMKPTSEARII